MSGICYIIAKQYWEAWGLFWKRSVSLCFLGVLFGFGFSVVCFVVLLSCFLCLLVTPRFLSHFFSHTGESPIKTKCIDDRLSFKRARHRQKKKTMVHLIVPYPNCHIHVQILSALGAGCCSSLERTVHFAKAGCVAWLPLWHCRESNPSAYLCRSVCTSGFSVQGQIVACIQMQQGSNLNGAQRRESSKTRSWPRHCAKNRCTSMSPSMITWMLTQRYCSPGLAPVPR